MNLNLKRIMVIDDEQDVGSFMQHYLSTRNFEVSIAYSAEQALEMLQEHPVDIILLDMLMTGMNGAMAARIINDKYPQVKIIIVTAYPKETYRIDSDIAIEGVFVKPFGIEDLFMKLTEM